AWLWGRRRTLRGSIAERYLREVRGIKCVLPLTLGFLPAWREHPPALITAFSIPPEPVPGYLGDPRDVRSVHVTLLRPDGSKAGVTPNKIMVGSPAGLPIVLAPPTDMLALAVAEGIEDALALHQALGMGAWAAGCASAMPKLADTIPNWIESVTIEVH